MVSTVGQWPRAIFSLDLRSIALFRMALAGVLATDALRRMFDARAHYSDQGVIPRADLIELRPYSFDWYLSLHFVNGDPWFQIAILAAAVGLAGLLFVGFRSRWTCLGLWLLVLSAQFRNPFISEGFDVYARTLLFWSLFLPLGARFSLDATARTTAPEARRLSVGTAILVAQIFIVYFGTGLFKLRSESWQSGIAIDNALQLPFYARPWSELFVGVPGLSLGLSYWTLLIELGCPLLLLLPRWTHIGRLVFIGALGSLHVGIALLLDVGLFSLLSLAALCVLLPSQAWEHPKVESAIDALRHRVRPLVERPPFATLRERLERLPSRIEPGVAGQAVAVIAFAFVLHYNAASFANPKSIPDYPRAILQPLLTLRLNQEWSMFANPTAPPHRFSFVTTRVLGGSERNALTDAPFSPHFTASEYNAQFPGHRWAKLFMRVFRRSDLQRLFAQYVCREKLDVTQVRFLAGSTEASLAEERAFPCAALR